jgi:phage-related protein
VLIYCGVKCLFGIDNMAEYKNMFLEAPKIIIEKGSIYINSHSLTKCKEIEEVLRSNLIILDSTHDKIYLDSDEICFLNNWDAEKYRKLL